MAPKLRVFSGAEVVKLFEAYSFSIVRTTGSHVRMTAVLHGVQYHITIPLHKTLKKGTLSGIAKYFQSIFGEEKTQKEFFG